MEFLPRTCEVAIIGAGFSGLCAAIRFKEAQITDFVVIERQADLGGVWRQNTYPGAACDVASALYSFSFENEYDWPRTHGSWRDILAYMDHCVDKFAIRDRLRFGTEVERLEWDSASARWLIRTTHGVLSATYVISACGLFSKPVIPDTPGLDAFAGDRLHSAMWDPKFEPAGKTVAVIGNGCSAAQIVPAIIEDAAHIYLVMRSPVHVLSKAERTYSVDERDLYRRFPILRALDRQSYINKSLDLAILPSNEEARVRVTPTILEHMSKQVADPIKRQAVLPDYPVMTKRPIRSDDYLKALDRAKVDILNTMIDRVTAKGMVMRDGRSFDVDALIFATGFEASEYLAPMEVIGRNGTHLKQSWSDGAHAYLGMLVPSFPNFVMIYGPNTNVVGSILQIIEPQVEAALSMLSLARASDGVIEISPEDEAGFNREVQDRLSRTVWGQTRVHNYFTAKSGRVVTQWPGTFLEFRDRLAAVDWSAFISKRTVTGQHRAAMATM